MQNKRSRVHMHKTKEAAIRAVIHVKWFHHKSFDLFRDDEEVVFAAVKRERENFSHASDRLRSSKEFVLKLLANGIYCVDLASGDVRADKDVAIASRSFPRASLSHLSETLRDDMDVVEAAIQSDYSEYSDASPRLQADRRIVLAAIRRASGYRLPFDCLEKGIPAALHGDAAVMTELLWLSPVGSVKLASEALLDDKTFGLMAARLNWGVISLLSSRLQKDPDIVFVGLSTAPHSVYETIIPDELKDDKSFVLSVVSALRGGLECASERLRDDDDVVLAAVLSSPHNALQNASQRLKSDKRFVLTACRLNPSAIHYADEGLRLLVGEKNPVAELNRLIDAEEQCLALKSRFDAQYGSGVRTRSVQKV